MTSKKSIIIVILLIFSISSFYFYSKIRTGYKLLRNEVISNLSSLGHRNDAYKIDEDINWKSILIEYDPYMVKVIFNQEPSTTYYYKYKENPKHGEPTIEVVRVKETVNTYIYRR